MNDIITTIKTGSPRERLAVIADIFGIGGISFVAVIGALASLPVSIRPLDLMQVVCYSLLFLALALLSLVAFYLVAQWICNQYASRPIIRKMLVASAASTFLAIFVGSSFVYYYRFIWPLRAFTS
jgi:hypothetical protein